MSSVKPANPVNIETFQGAGDPDAKPESRRACQTKSYMYPTNPRVCYRPIVDIIRSVQLCRMTRLFLLGVLLLALADEAEAQPVAGPGEHGPPALSGGASAQAEASPDPGLTMVPARCFNAERQEVPTANVTVLHNKVVTFSMNGLTLRSEIQGATVMVKYSNEPEWTAIFEILTVVNYNASDARVYHGTLAGRPILLWEETVENRARRAGIVGYRGRVLFPVCEGVIRTPDELRRREGRRSR